MLVTIEAKDKYGMQISAEFSADHLELLQRIINLNIPVYAYAIPDSVKPFPIVKAIVEKLIADGWIIAPNGFKL